MAENATESRPNSRTRRGTLSTKSERPEPESRERDEPERGDTERSHTDTEQSHTDAAEAHEGSDGGLDAVAAARLAMEQLGSLTNREAEGVVGVEGADGGGWAITVEVVESRRIPDTADVLAEYAVTLDRAGRVSSYTRRSRYLRGRARVDS